MEIFFIILGSVLSGVVAGMGMGGGTILIPVLTIFFSFPQKLAQGTNLFVFLPTAIVSLYVHIKNKLVEIKSAITIIISGVIASAVASIMANKIDNASLQFYFGIFLLLVGIYQIVMAVYFQIKLFKNAKSEAEKSKYNYKISAGIRWF